jgi:P27 family predicted phage terminase small subunit
VRGAKPKPVEQKIIEGNPGQRELPEILLIGGRPDQEEMSEPPEFLPRDAKDFWRDAVQKLYATGMLDLVDRAALEMLAVTYARWRQAVRVIAADGHFAMAPGGNLRVHPAIKIEREASQSFFRMAEHYGLTPVARTRLGMAELHRRSLANEIQDSLGNRTDETMDVIDSEPL